MDVIWFLLVGLIAGWLAGKLTRGAGFGAIGDIVVGVVGAFIGGYVFRFLGLTASGTLGAIAVATVGAVVLVLIVRALKRA